MSRITHSSSISISLTTRTLDTRWTFKSSAMKLQFSIRLSIFRRLPEHNSSKQKTQTLIVTEAIIQMLNNCINVILDCLLRPRYHFLFSKACARSFPLHNDVSGALLERHSSDFPERAETLQRHDNNKVKNVLPMMRHHCVWQRIFNIKKIVNKKL